MKSVVENYYTVQQLAWLVQFDAKTIRTWIHEGKFGTDVLNFGGNDLRVPASDVNAFLDQQRLFARPDVEPIAARSEGELKRKVLADGHRAQG